MTFALHEYILATVKNTATSELNTEWWWVVLICKHVIQCSSCCPGNPTTKLISEYQFSINISVTGSWWMVYWSCWSFTYMIKKREPYFSHTRTSEILADNRTGESLHVVDKPVTHKTIYTYKPQYSLFWTMFGIILWAQFSSMRKGRTLPSSRFWILFTSDRGLEQLTGTFERSTAVTIINEDMMWRQGTKQSIFKY